MNQYAALRGLESAFGVRPLGHARATGPNPWRQAFTRALKLKP